MEVFGFNLWKHTLSALTLARGLVEYIGQGQFVVNEAELKEFVTFAAIHLLRFVHTLQCKQHEW